VTGSVPRRRRRRLAGVLVLSHALVVSGVLAVGGASPFSSREETSRAGSRSPTPHRLAPASSLALPGPVKPAFAPGKPVFLRSSAHVSRWAVIRTEVTVRAEPRIDAPAVAHLATRTPEGTSNIVLVLDHRVGEAGRLWIRVRPPVLDNQKTGWVPRAALGGYGTVRTRLVIDLGSFTATLLRDGREIFRARVGVGKPSWPTPTGEFYVRNKLTGYASPMYGPIAFGTSARSRVLTDWPAGGFVGIHGTDRPDLLPGRVSHGCIRMRNADILQLARLMPVGTPLTIR
jgi:lipoprotein-anchoring transpeptidase ErfK/SrfK